MNFIKDTLNRVLDDLGCNAICLTDIEVNNIRVNIEQKFSEKKDSSLLLWENLKQHQSKYDPNGWKAIEDYPYNSEVIIFFDDQSERTMFRFDNIKDVVKVLAECPGFVFYLTDNNFDFLICHNDHDYLIGAGHAADWIKV